MLDLKSLSNRELLDAWTQSLDVLYERGIIRTYNNPIGDIAEEMVARFYGGVRGTFAQAAWDVAVGDDLLQVKACRRATPTTKLGFSPIRHREGYTALILVVFTAHMRVAEAWRIPRETVNEMAAFNDHVNGLKLGLTAKAMNEARGAVCAAQKHRCAGCRVEAQGALLDPGGRQR